MASRMKWKYKYKIPPSSHRLINIAEFTEYKTNDGCVQEEKKLNEMETMGKHRREDCVRSVHAARGSVKTMKSTKGKKKNIM